MSENLVTVIIPAFNSENYIEETLQSVQKQTYQNLEILVIDDFSSDNTYKITENYAKEDKRINLFKKKSNKGVAHSRNVAYKIANGQFVAFVDSDDVWPLNKIENQVTFMTKNNISFSYSDYYVYDCNTKKRIGIQKTPEKSTYTSMLMGNMIGSSSVMLDKERIGKIEIPFLKKRNDTALWLKALKKIEAAYRVPGLYYIYKKRQGSLSSGRKYKLLKHHYLLYRQSEKFNPLISASLSAINVVVFFIKKLFFYEKLI